MSYIVNSILYSFFIVFLNACAMSDLMTNEYKINNKIVVAYVNSGYSLNYIIDDSGELILIRPNIIKVEWNKEIIFITQKKDSIYNYYCIKNKSNYNNPRRSIIGPFSKKESLLKFIKENYKVKNLCKNKSSNKCNILVL